MRNPRTFVSEYMPVYSLRIVKVKTSLEQGSKESRFPTHYDGEVPLRKGEKFFGRRSGGGSHWLLDICCGADRSPSIAGRAADGT